MKQNVYLVDLGTGTNRNLLPLSVGLLSSYAKSIPQIDETFKFDIHFLRTDPRDAIARFENPVVVGLACYIWNLKASLYFARLTKQRFPQCLIVVGGYSIPKRPDRLKSFLDSYPYVDVLVHGEGEFTFADLLSSLASGRELFTVNGISFRCPDGEAGFVTNPSRARIEDLNDIPSPFLNGTFDDLMAKYRRHVTGAVWETTRGCPFSCTFCDWGNADVNKVKSFEVDRLYDELKWMSKNEIYYIYGADANFGIFYQRDLEIAGRLAELCKSSGYPKYLMINWTKNSHEKIVTIADRLHDGGVLTNVTLAMQSFHGDTLSAIKRRNIKPDSLIKLKKAFHDRNLSTFTELILALPEEDFNTFLHGLNQAMTPRLSDHFGVYLCSILENTEMATPEYMEKYQIETRICSVAMSRRVFQETDEPETEEVVVGTSTMPVDDWQRAYMVGYFCLALYNFRIAFFIMNYLQREFGNEYTDYLEFVLSEIDAHPGSYDRLQQGVDHLRAQQNQVLNNVSSVSPVPGLGDIVFWPHEAVLVILLNNVDDLYVELGTITRKFCDARGIEVAQELLDEIVLYQKIRMPVWPQPTWTHYTFTYDVPVYFDALTRGLDVGAMQERPTGIEVLLPEQVSGDYVQFVMTRARAGHTVDIYDVKIGKVASSSLPLAGGPVRAMSRA